MPWAILVLALGALGALVFQVASHPDRFVVVRATPAGELRPSETSSNDVSVAETSLSGTSPVDASPAVVSSPSVVPGPPAVSSPPVKPSAVRAPPAERAPERAPTGTDDAWPPSPDRLAGGVPAADPPGDAASRRAARRRAELGVLPDLSARLRFVPGGPELESGARAMLDRIFDPLFLYPRTRVLVTFGGAELAERDADRRLAEGRAATLVDYLVERGIARERFELRFEPGTALPAGRQRVIVATEVPRS